MQLIPTRTTSRGARADGTDLESLRLLLGEPPYLRERLIEYLHRIQDHHGHLPRRSRLALASLLSICPCEVNETATFYAHFRLQPAKHQTLRICTSPVCRMAGAQRKLEALAAHFGDRVEIAGCGCIGQCHRPPAALFGQRVVPRLTEDEIERALLGEPDREQRAAPESLPDYCTRGGYGPAGVPDLLAELEEADLRGMGGAGFPVARKWRAVMARPAPRVLVVNLDEGEPGTFKDRWLLERQPHQILDGALLAARNVGCERIMIYLRDEYAEARRILQEAISALVQSPVPHPPLELRRGAGAYICGEESALIESLEGKRGLPRQRPPLVAERGFQGLPTLVHNGETLWWVAEIARRGAAFYHNEGRRGHTGLRHYSVSGRVRHPGVYLAPMGISARELIDEYAGGMAEGETLYGYFPGGASGGMLPARLADLPLAFGALEEHGCFVGSGAVIVFSHRDSARDLALCTMRFFRDESCGQCTPCRVGTERAVQMMASGQWPQQTLRELARLMQDTSICGLGQAAPNPMLSAMRHFPEELGHE